MKIFSIYSVALTVALSWYSASSYADIEIVNGWVRCVFSSKDHDESGSSKYQTIDLKPGRLGKAEQNGETVFIVKDHAKYSSIMQKCWKKAEDEGLDIGNLELNSMAGVTSGYFGTTVAPLLVQIEVEASSSRGAGSREQVLADHQTLDTLAKLLAQKAESGASTGSFGTMMTLGAAAAVGSLSYHFAKGYSGGAPSIFSMWAQHLARKAYEKTCEPKKMPKGIFAKIKWGLLYLFVYIPGEHAVQESAKDNPIAAAFAGAATLTAHKVVESVSNGSLSANTQAFLQDSFYR